MYHGFQVYMGHILLPEVFCCRSMGAILLVSLALLFKPLPMLVAPWLLVQVLYKLMTSFTVGGFTNAVVISNLLVAALHLITLYLIYRTIRGKAFNLEPS